jgi:3-phosphoshikimate 1-carboxyvinyltransferase
MKCITPSRIDGQVRAPSSKSMTVRALAAGLLAKGVSRIENVSLCDDGLVAASAIEDLGAVVERSGKTFMVHGTGKAGLTPKKGILDCGESGLSIRMFAPVAALIAGETRLVASGSLMTRPMEMVDALQQVGASVRTEKGRAPITVRGPMRGGRIDIDASVSSQLLTGLLMALPLCDEPSTIHATRLKSGPYVKMTLELLKDFGIRIGHDDALEDFSIEGGQEYQQRDYTIEGDWSGAAFLLVAGATAGRITVTGLNLFSLQADRAILEVLTETGAVVKTVGDRVSVSSRELAPFRFDATGCPDLFPPLVALAANCPGKSAIHGVERLAHKESDRATALRAEFEKLGIRIEISDNAMEIYGGEIKGGVVESYNDHRIAMACAVTGLTARSAVTIKGPECVAKSYPEFFADLEKLQVTR